MSLISVLVVDDQPAFRKAASAVIAAIDELSLCAEASDLAGALAGLTQLHGPSLAIVDLQLGDENGVDVCRQLMACRPDLTVFLVSAMSEDDLPSSVYTCGAAGFIAKHRFGPVSLVDALSSTGHLR